MEYTSQSTVCDGVVKPGTDYVYAASRLGDQRTIAQVLNENIKSIEPVIAEHDKDCVKLVFRALCHFYLPPCGNSTHAAFPSSVCQEECTVVQEKCETVWNTILSAFNNTDPVIHCNDTSKLLFPVPHCCSDILLDPDSLTTSPDTNSSPKKNRGIVTWAVVGTTVFIILAALVVVVIVVPLVVRLAFKRHKRRQLERVQLDILAV